MLILKINSKYHIGKYHYDLCSKYHIQYILVPEDKKLILLKLSKLNVLKNDGPDAINFGALLKPVATSLGVIAKHIASTSSYFKSV